MAVTITPGQRKRFVKTGRSLILAGLTTGFQLEDFDPKTKNPTLIYGHDNPKHLNRIQKEVGGKRFPRESYYKFNPEWTAGINTTLYHNRTFAKEKGEYIETNRLSGKNFIRKRAVKSINGRGTIHYSWAVPDVRIYRSGKPQKGFRTAYQITKRIDHDSRLSLLVTQKSKVDAIRKRMKNERIKKVRVQDYPRKASFWKFIS